MPLGRRNPFEEIEELLERMGDQLESDAWPVAGDIDVDVAEHDDRYVVDADLPGYDREGIDVRLVGGALHIEAERDLDVDDDAADYLQRERRREPVRRRISLAEPVDEDSISATHTNGVLWIELPKEGPDAGTSIDID